MKTETPSVKMVAITEDEAGQRIDNFLRTQLKGVPKSMIYRILRKGEVRVNKKRVKPEYKIEAGDEVRIPPVRVAEREEQAVSPHLNKVAALTDVILYEDDHILVLNKPSGTAVHGGSGLSFGVIEGLRALRPEARFLELVHRLDRDTSGILLVAKKRSALLRKVIQIAPGGENAAHAPLRHTAYRVKQAEFPALRHFIEIGAPDMPAELRRPDPPAQQRQPQAGVELAVEEKALLAVCFRLRDDGFCQTRFIRPDVDVQRRELSSGFGLFTDDHKRTRIAIAWRQPIVEKPQYGLVMVRDIRSQYVNQCSHARLRQSKKTPQQAAK
jgi:ribosomal 50S subunit-recycling heat shock protein